MPRCACARSWRLYEVKPPLSIARVKDRRCTIKNRRHVGGFLDAKLFLVVAKCAACTFCAAGVLDAAFLGLLTRLSKRTLGGFVWRIAIGAWLPSAGFAC